MALLKTNGNRTLFPALVDDFFNTDVFFTPRLIDVNGGLNGLIENIPSANITETNDAYKIQVAAPGLEKKDFKIEVENGLLSVSAEKQTEEKEEKENYSRREFSYNSFSRTFSLPENSVSDKLEAKYDKGILSLTLPKKEITLTKPKKEIKVS